MSYPNNTTLTKSDKKNQQSHLKLLAKKESENY